MPLVQVVDLLLQGNIGQVKYLAIAASPNATEATVVVDSGVDDPDRLNHVTAYIRLIAESAAETKMTTVAPPGVSQVTRLTTDEFSFYPRDRPFTIEEYKAIIAETARIAKELPPDIHLVLATFPVIWPDGGVHNCGLYVESPNDPDKMPTMHHFSKQNFSSVDFVYRKLDGTFYPLSADENCTAEQSSDVVLRDTEVVTNDVNQYGGALKLTTSTGETFISTVGICLDHAQGVERKEVQCLMQQLQRNQQSIPFLCTHVITSYSISQVKDNVLSTVSHADPYLAARQFQTTYARELWGTPMELPELPACVQRHLANPFSSSIPTIEQYRPKLIGTFHSDLFLQAFGSNPPLAPSDSLNTPDENGNTELHRVFLSDTHDHELLGKRLYAMILAGGDPYIQNFIGQDTYDTAYQTSSIVCNYVTEALERRRWLQESTEQTLYEEFGVLHGDIKTMPNATSLAVFVFNGGNPYQKNAQGNSVLDIMRMYPPFDRVFLTGQVTEMFQLTHSNPLQQHTEAVEKKIKDISMYTAANYQLFLRALSPTQCLSLIQEMGANLSQFIEQSDVDKLKLFIHCMWEYLPSIIGSVYDLGVLLNKVDDPSYRSALFALPIPSLRLEQQKVQEKCAVILQDISDVRMQSVDADPQMDAFLQQKQDLLQKTTDLYTLYAIKDELQTTFDALQGDKNEDKAVSSYVSIRDKYRAQRQDAAEDLSTNDEQDSSNETKRY